MGSMTRELGLGLRREGEGLRIREFEGEKGADGAEGSRRG